jgi:hypothetical protein
MNPASLHDSKYSSLNGGDAKCYRCHRYYLYLGICCVVLFVSVGIIYPIVIFWDKDSFPFQHRTLLAFLCAAFWSGWAVLGVWIILAYFRSRLFISESHVESIGVLNRKYIVLDELTQVVWRSRPIGGSVVLHAPNCKIVIEFENFTKEQRAEMVDFLHNKISHEIQDGWDGFYKFFSKQFEPRQGLSRSFFIFNSVVLFSFGVLFIFIWNAGYGQKYLSTSIINLIVGLSFLCIAIKKKRKLETNTNLC